MASNLHYKTVSFLFVVEILKTLMRGRKNLRISDWQEVQLLVLYRGIGKSLDIDLLL
jgi:hypothetical protein